MKNQHFLISVLTLCLILGYSLSDVYSYPWFARRLVDNCNKCHVAFPKTNDYGQYVKTTGYELPEISYEGLEESPIRRFLRYFPLAARFEVDAINSDPADVKGDLTFREIQIISGGSILNNKVSWWFHKHVVQNNDYVSLFDGTPHEMWGQYNLKFSKNDVTRVSLRYGMSELPLAFSPSKTMLSEIPYAIYNAALGANNFTLSTPEYGFAVFATKMGGDNYNQVKANAQLAVVNGKAEFSNGFSNIFGRVSVPIGRASLGTFAYFGSNDLPMAMEHHDDEMGEENEDSMDEMMMGNNFHRLGLDFTCSITPNANLYALALYGRDSNPQAFAESRSGRFFGGFAGLDYFLNERLMLQFRYDGVRFDGPTVEQHDDEIGEGHEASMDDMDMDHEGEGGHMHGARVTADMDDIVLGLHFIPFKQFERLKLVTEYKFGLKGTGDLLMSGFHLAF